MRTLNKPGKLGTEGIGVEEVIQEKERYIKIQKKKKEKKVKKMVMQVMEEK